MDLDKFFSVAFSRLYGALGDAWSLSLIDSAALTRASRGSILGIIFVELCARHLVLIPRCTICQLEADLRGRRLLVISVLLGCGSIATGTVSHYHLVISRLVFLYAHGASSSRLGVPHVLHHVSLFLAQILASLN